MALVRFKRRYFTMFGIAILNRLPVGTVNKGRTYLIDITTVHVDVLNILHPWW